MATNITESRRQRQFRDRENMILEVAEKTIIEQGFYNLHMAKLARAIEYSTGTLYLHFACKEDILLAVTAKRNQKRTELLTRASRWEEKSRDKMFAMVIGFSLFVQLHPGYFHLDQLAKERGIWAKASEERRQAVLDTQREGIIRALDVIREAIGCGDLLPEGESPVDILFGIWTHCIGAYQLFTTSTPLRDYGIMDPFDALERNVSHYLDGIKWKPVGKRWDRHEVHERARQQLYLEEFAEVEAMKLREESGDGIEAASGNRDHESER